MSAIDTYTKYFEKNSNKNNNSNNNTFYNAWLSINNTRWMQQITIFFNSNFAETEIAQVYHEMHKSSI